MACTLFIVQCTMSAMYNAQCRGRWIISPVQVQCVDGSTQPTLPLFNSRNANFRIYDKMLNIKPKKKKTFNYNVHHHWPYSPLYVFIKSERKKMFENNFFAGCILCELLTGYPLLPGEDEGENLKCSPAHPHCSLLCRGPAFLHHRAVRDAPAKTSRPVKAGQELYLLKRYK